MRLFLIIQHLSAPGYIKLPLVQPFFVVFQKLLPGFCSLYLLVVEGISLQKSKAISRYAT